MTFCTRISARCVSRLLVVLSVLAVGLAAPVLPAANAVTTPRPLNDTRPVSAAPVEVAFAIEHFGVVAELASRDAQLDDHGPAPYGEARFRVRGQWTPWRPMAQDGAQQPGQFTGALLAVDRADAYQVRALPTAARGWRAAAINVSDGPRVVTGHRPSTVAGAYPSCMSRADWGADETITGWAKGQAQDFAPVQVMTVHHTAGSNDPSQDYAATVRAIFDYHVRSNGWSDIGYQYLVDRHGTMYEGRNAWYRGDRDPRDQQPSRSCLSASDPSRAGDGTDFGHRTNAATGVEEIVTGAHTGSYNTGNIGIALLGCFDDSSACTGSGFSTAPPAVGLRRLEDQLATLSVRHRKDPLGSTTYTNANGSRAARIVSGHRDWSSTACPGNLVYEGLQQIRQNAADLISGPKRVTDLAATASGADVTVTWTPEPVRYEVYRATGAAGDGPTLVHTTAAGAAGWTDPGRAAGTYYYLVRGVAVTTAADGTSRSVPGVTSNQRGVTVAAPTNTPTAVAHVDTAACADAACSFTGSGSGTLSWSFGGSATPTSATGSQARTTFTSAGEHSVVLTATDGAATARDAHPVTCTWSGKGRTKKLTCTTPPPD